MQLDGKNKLIHLCFLRQGHGVSVEDIWMAWFDDYGSRCHGYTPEAAIVNLIDTYNEHREFREAFKRAIDKSIASFRTPVIG